MPNKKVLILDGENRSSLAVIRSIGKLNFTIISASNLPNSISSASKYTNGSIISPCKTLGIKIFINWLEETVKNLEIDYIIPTSEFSLNAIYNNKYLLDKLNQLPFPSLDSFNQSIDKYALAKKACAHKINTPSTYLLSSEDYNYKQLKDLLGSTFVLKPRYSVQYEEDIPNKPPIKYVKEEQDFLSFITTGLSKDYDYIAQEYIKGTGVGLFYFYINSKTIASFAHKRILEKPPEGGVSVLSESFHAPFELYNKCESLLNDLNWNGVAMVEFKLDKNSEYQLIEINPRFWGSLQLAIDCGVDFPKLLFNNLDTENIWNNFSEGMRLRWEIGLLDHMLINLKRKNINYLKDVFLKNSLELFKIKTNNEVFKTEDFMPGIAEIKGYLK